MRITCGQPTPCVQQLINSDSNLSDVDNRWAIYTHVCNIYSTAGLHILFYLLCINIVIYVAFKRNSALHVAAKLGNVKAVDVLLNASECQDCIIDVNKCDYRDFTAVYYAIQASR